MGIYYYIMNYSKIQWLQILLFYLSAHDSEMWAELGEASLSLFYMVSPGVDHWRLEDGIPRWPHSHSWQLLSADWELSCWLLARGLNSHPGGLSTWLGGVFHRVFRLPE